MPGWLLNKESFLKLLFLNKFRAHVSIFVWNSSEEMLKVPDMRLIFSKNQSFVVRNHIFSFPENEVGDHACFSYFTLQYNFTGILILQK